MRVAAYQADGFISADSSYTPTLRALGTGGDADILVAVTAGRITGTVMLQPAASAGQVVTGPDEAEIRALAVAPAARGLGTGRALLTAVIARAAQRDVRHLVLCTQSDMAAARHMYEMAGFRRLADRDWSPGPGIVLLAYGLVLPSAG